jgi:hypothetical protein
VDWLQKVREKAKAKAPTTAGHHFVPIASNPSKAKTPTAAAPQMAEKRFILKATSPKGNKWLQTHPKRQ